MLGNHDDFKLQSRIARGLYQELFEEIDRDGPAIEGEADTAELIRQGREERERELEARTMRGFPPE